MGQALAVSLTQLTDYLGLLISLWLMFYLLARGSSNPLTLRMALILLSLSVYYYSTFSSSFLNIEHPSSIAGTAVVAAFAFGFDLAYNLIPANLRRKYRPIYISIMTLAVVAAVSGVWSTSTSAASQTVDPILQARAPLLIMDIFDLLAAFAMLYSLRIIFVSKIELIHGTFYGFVIFGGSTVILSLIGVLFQLAIPHYISNLMVLIALVLLAYSIGRYQSLIDSRVSLRDFPISVAAIIIIALLFAFASTSFDLPPKTSSLLIALAVVSHSVYDLLRVYLFRHQDRAENSLRREVRQLSRNQAAQPFQSTLRRALAILCHNLNAVSGFIALIENDQLRIQSSYHSLPIGALLDDIPAQGEDLFKPLAKLAEHAQWARWVYSGNQAVGIIALGPRSELRTYTESNLDWLEDVADQIGNIFLSQSGSTSASNLQGNLLLSTLATQPHADVIKNVEDGFRNLNDFIKLGDSDLISILGIGGDTNIQRGKAVSEKLVEMLNTLRPSGEMPVDPIPREWYSYTILDHAYVQDIPDRDIMAKLYISEGTFYRTRRKALRGLSRAVLELTTVD
ncbi:MAG: GAF domain-containing protein [Chloroflexota bacterium]